jgi:chorismate mutase
MPSKKKAKRGIATPKREMDVLRRRLKQAEAHYQANYVEGYADAPNQRG